MDAIGMWKDIWSKVFLVNMVEKRRGNAELFDHSEIQALALALTLKNALISTDVPYISTDNPIPALYEVLINPNDLDKVVLELLNIGCGKMSLCGGAALGMVRDAEGSGGFSDYDLFFHCDPQEADDILEKCLYYIDGLDLGPRYTRTQNVITVIWDTIDDVKVQFIKRLYKTKDQVLLGFDMAGCQCGWNPVDGFFTTLQGMFALVTSFYPVDSTQFTTTYNIRLSKYLKKGFKILLPGLGKRVITFENSDCVFQSPTHLDYGRYEMHLKNKSRMHISDYDTRDSCPTVLDKYPSMFRFSMSTAKECLELPDEVVVASMPYPRMPPLFTIDGLMAKSFLGDKFTEFVNAHVINGDAKEAKRIWDSNEGNYYNKVRELATKIKTFARWKVDNPGCQRFGKFNPLPADPVSWYGGNYNPVFVGISDDRYRAWMQCRNQVSCIASLPDDLWRLLCQYWLEGEAKEAEMYLHSLFQ